MKMFRCLLLTGALLLAPLIAMPAWAVEQSVIATVNDVPVTTFDIEQRLRLMKILGTDRDDRGKKYAANAIIDEVVKISEAKKYKVNPSEKEIDSHLERMAKGLKTDAAGLKGKLKAQGIAESSLRQYLAAQISFARILAGKYKVKVEVNPTEVDRKYAEIKTKFEQQVKKVMSDPRMKPITVYALREIEFPVEQTGDAADQQLLQARAVEAVQFLKKFKGCGNAKAAASGIFDVRVGKQFEADAAKLPKELRKLLDKRGVGNAIGPMRGQKGIQVIAFCSKRTIKPPKPQFEMPTRQQVENAVSNEKYAVVEEKYLKQLRKTALIEYKDQTYAP